MPTYVYKFIDSGETIEVQQAFSDDTLTEYPHPETGETRAVKKVFLPVGVTFKGDGFYKTDSRSSSKASSPSSSSSTDSGDSSSKNGDSSGGGSDSATSSGSSSSSSSSSDSSGSSKAAASPAAD